MHHVRNVPPAHTSQLIVATVQQLRAVIPATTSTFPNHFFILHPSGPLTNHNWHLMKMINQRKGKK